jgi:hypothetical protein
MAGQIQLRPAVLTDKINDGEGVGNPFIKRMVPELPAAFTVAVQIKAQGGKAGIPHRGSGQDVMRPVPGAGETVKQDYQRTPAASIRFFQDRAQLDSVVTDDHDLPSFSQSGFQSFA